MRVQQSCIGLRAMQLPTKDKGQTYGLDVVNRKRVITTVRLMITNSLNGGCYPLRDRLLFEGARRPTKQDAPTMTGRP